MQRSLARVSFVNADGVVVRVGNESHLANRSRERLHAKLHFVVAEMGDGTIEVLDF